MAARNVAGAHPGGAPGGYLYGRVTNVRKLATSALERSVPREAPGASQGMTPRAPAIPVAPETASVKSTLDFSRRCCCSRGSPKGLCGGVGRPPSSRTSIWPRHPPVLGFRRRIPVCSTAASASRAALSSDTAYARTRSHSTRATGTSAAYHRQCRGWRRLLARHNAPVSARHPRHGAEGRQGYCSAPDGADERVSLTDINQPVEKPWLSAPIGKGQRSTRMVPQPISWD